MKHKIQYYSPGFFFCDKREVEVEKFDPKEAKERAKDCEFSFRHIRYSASNKNIKDRISGFYYIDGKVITTKEIERINVDKQYDILIRNLNCNSSGVGVLTRLHNYFQEFDNKKDFII